jgi:hypothetical protein
MFVCVLGLSGRRAAGLYAAGVAFTTLVGGLATLGSRSVIIRDVAASGEDSHTRVPRVLALRVSLGTGLALVAGVVTTVHSKNITTSFLVAGAVLVPVVADHVESVAIGLGRVSDLWVAALSWIVPVALVVISRHRAATWLVWFGAYVSVYGLRLLIFVRGLCKADRSDLIKPNFLAPLSTLREFVPYMGVALLAVAIANLPVLVVTRLSGLELAAEFELTIKAMTAVAIIATSASSALVARWARWPSQRQESRKLVSRVLTWGSLSFSIGGIVATASTKLVFSRIGQNTSAELLVNVAAIAAPQAWVAALLGAVYVVEGRGKDILKVSAVYFMLRMAAVVSGGLNGVLPLKVAPLVASSLYLLYLFNRISEIAGRTSAFAVAGAGAVAAALSASGMMRTCLLVNASVWAFVVAREITANDRIIDTR